MTNIIFKTNKSFLYLKIFKTPEMLSNSTKYAIKAVLYLALNSDELNKITVKDIAEPINVPQAYIAKLLQELSRKQIISSTRGPKGGFYLSAADRKNSVIDILAALDSEGRLDACLLSLENCNTEKPCPLHDIAYPLKSQLLKNFNSKTIEDLAATVRNGSASLPL